MAPTRRRQTLGYALQAQELAGQKAAIRYGHGANWDAIAAVPDWARSVLDVGCGTGATGAVLKCRRQIHVCGIEIDRQAAAEARKVLDEVVCGDAAGTNIFSTCGTFDCIIYGDVLEHLVWPGDVLRSHRCLLAPRGVIVITVPNVQYIGVIAKLLLGTWRYAPCGILDVTHLRFFTRRSLLGMIDGAGYRVISLHRGSSMRPGLRALDCCTAGMLGHFLSHKYTALCQPV